jgi:hypothetical protein
MHLAVGDVNEGGDRAMQIEQRVHFESPHRRRPVAGGPDDSGLMLAEPGPEKQRQTEIDGR